MIRLQQSDNRRVERLAWNCTVSILLTYSTLPYPPPPHYRTHSHCQWSVSQINSVRDNHLPYPSSPSTAPSLPYTYRQWPKTQSSITTYRTLTTVSHSLVSLTFRFFACCMSSVNAPASSCDSSASPSFHGGLQIVSQFAIAIDLPYPYFEIISVCDRATVLLFFPSRFHGGLQRNHIVSQFAIGTPATVTQS